MDQDKRVGMNEAIFRQVNEQIKSLDDELGVDDGTITVICECGDAECTERLELPLAKYDQIRSDSLLYVIVPGHEFAGEVVSEPTQSGSRQHCPRAAASFGATDARSDQWHE